MIVSERSNCLVTCPCCHGKRRLTLVEHEDVAGRTVVIHPTIRTNRRGCPLHTLSGVDLSYIVPPAFNPTFSADKSPADADEIAIGAAIGRAENCDSLLDCVRRFGASEAVVGKKVMEAVALHVAGRMLLIEANAPPKERCCRIPSHA